MKSNEHERCRSRVCHGSSRFSGMVRRAHTCRMVADSIEIGEGSAVDRVRRMGKDIHSVISAIPSRGLSAEFAGIGGDEPGTARTSGAGSVGVNANCSWGSFRVRYILLREMLSSCSPDSTDDHDTLRENSFYTSIFGVATSRISHPGAIDGMPGVGELIKVHIPSRLHRKLGERRKRTRHLEQCDNRAPDG